ncbi:MAG TPA: hypothetical protein VKD91_00055 [Pyrinomonadaceae bacterium]|nr:hypothetical protein [Pyrinomonadaceae bacterium]
MRVLLYLIFLTLCLQGCQLAKSQAQLAGTTPLAAADSNKKPDFNTEIKPILQARCQPCHFQGGTVYQKLPFDKPETITRLGTKLFTRIKDEKERQLIREFLAQP